jgi:hypothetical protein
MGASESQPQVSKETETAVSNLFVLVVTAPPGVGKEGLMGSFIGQYLGRIAYVAMAGAVTASEPVRLTFMIILHGDGGHVIGCFRSCSQRIWPKYDQNRIQFSNLHG